MKPKRMSKMKRAVHALAQISFLDLNPNATLAAAIALAQEALQDIGRDEILVSPKIDKGTHAIVLEASSAAGNPDLVMEILKQVADAIDATLEADGQTAFQWSEVRVVEHLSGTSRQGDGG